MHWNKFYERHHQELFQLLYQDNSFVQILNDHCCIITIHRLHLSNLAERLYQYVTWNQKNDYDKSTGNKNKFMPPTANKTLFFA